MILADSILQTASMALCVSVAVTASDQNIFDPQVQERGARKTEVRGKFTKNFCYG
jgi:hypothetical protein